MVSKKYIPISEKSIRARERDLANMNDPLYKILGCPAAIWRYQNGANCKCTR